MVQTKKPPVIKWNAYTDGEIKNQIIKEINNVMAKKEYRRKVGLETGAIREFKGNTHWNLYIDIKLAELISRRLSSDLKNIFIQTSQNMSNTNGYLASIAQQIKKTEYNLSNVTTVSSNNTIKFVRSEITKMNKAIVSITAAQKEIKTASENLQAEIESASNAAKDELIAEFQKNHKEQCDRNEATQTIITDDINAMKDQIQVRISELNDTVSEERDNNTQSFKIVNKSLTELSKDLKNTEEHLSTFQEATNNMFDDQQKTIVTEFQEGVGGLMKQNLDTSNKTEKLMKAETKELTTRVDESSENLTSIIEATNEHLDKVAGHVKEHIKSTESQIKKELNTEVTDLRTILSTIRSDIELMKSVLTKVDSKIH
jgi:hypothetical protein